MKEFHSIESLQHAVTRIKGWTEFHGLTERPTILFRGTVKLHGTNAGVHVTPDAVVAQGRSRVLTITEDNYGFAHFVSGRENTFRVIAACIAGTSADLTIFGEWCGIGIHKGMGINNLPKHFVIFAVYNNTTETWVQLDVVNSAVTAVGLSSLNDVGVYSIGQVPAYSVSIDFNDPTEAAQYISDMTLAVEEQCPWAKLHGFEGLGEGIVWISTPESFHEEVKFKSKGLKHKKTGVPRVPTDPVKVESIGLLVDELLPEWRLEQGIEHLRENNLPFLPTSTGAYIKWVAQDILKEEAATIAANPYNWKELVNTISRRARDYYLNFLNGEAGLPTTATT